MGSGLRRTCVMELQAVSNRVRTALPEPAARLVGPTYRRARREWQWRSSGADLDLAHTPPDGRLTAGVGGGLCQLTNLIHWMTLHTELTVVERWRHSYDVFPDNGRTVPFASGATCSYPSLDLQIENRTLSSYRLGLRVGPTDLEGVWTADYPPPRTYQVYEAAHVITNDGPGIHFRRNMLRRRVLDPSGDVIDDEFLTHNHARMCYAPMLPA